MVEKRIIKSKIKTLKAILYVVMLVWVLILAYTVYDFFSEGNINPYLVLVLILMVSAMSVVKLLKSAQQKKLSESEK